MTASAAASPNLATPNLASGLTGDHQRVLARIFQHPLSHNLAWREVLSLFTTIGAVTHQHDGDTVLHLGEQHVSFKPRMTRTCPPPMSWCCATLPPGAAGPRMPPRGPRPRPERRIWP